MKRTVTRIQVFLLTSIGIVLLISVLAPYLVPYDAYDTNPDAILQAPSATHWFGTDNFGRDVFSRVLIGSTTSIFASFAIIVIATIIGCMVGMIGGYYGGRVDAILMRITDIFLAFPDLLLAIAVAGVLGGGLVNAMVAIIATTWTQYARLSRSLVQDIKNETFVKAAKISGATNGEILLHHILPNTWGLIIVTAVLHISTVVMGLAGLSFLGLGVRVPDAEWGSMISEGLKVLYQAPWVALSTSLVLVIVMMLFNPLGDQVRDYLDPKTNRGERP